MTTRQAPVTERMVQQFLNAAKRHRWTLDTWLTRNLRGRAKEYSLGYRTRMLAVLDGMERAGAVKRVPSARGSETFIRTPLDIIAKVPSGYHRISRVEAEAMARQAPGPNAHYVSAGVLPPKPPAAFVTLGGRRVLSNAWARYALQERNRR